jgi:hypothetical protein
MYKQPASQQYKVTNQGNDHALQKNQPIEGSQGQNNMFMGHAPAYKDQLAITRKPEQS